MSNYRHLPLSHGMLSFTAIAVVLAAAPTFLSGTVAAQDPINRSLSAEPLMRRNDPRDRPRVPERQTHRGWEIMRDTFTVVCGTNHDEAVFAANQYQQAWDEMKHLMDPWTTIQQNPDFGLGAAEITIDKEPLKDPSQLLTTLQVNNNMMIVYLNVAPGQPSLQEQLPELRMAAVYSMMHSAQFDQKLPGWVRDGLAVYVAEKCAELNGGTKTPLPAILPLDSQYWQRQRVSRQQLEPRWPPSIDSAAQVRFFLEGFDCRFAPAFFESLRETVNTAAPSADLQARNITRGIQLARRPTIVDYLVERLQPQYETWKREPLAGQPIIVPMGNENQTLAAAEREVALVLKLARRFSPKSGAVASGAPGTATTRTASKVKITEFKKGTTVEAPSSQNVVTPVSIQQVYDRIAAQTVPWATLDADGQILTSNNRDRIQQLFGLGNSSISIESREQQTIVRKYLPDGGAIEGWLEENREHPLRPIAKFAKLQAGSINR